MAVIAYTGMTQREEAIREGYNLTRFVAEKIVSEQSVSVAGVEQLMVTLAQLPEIKSGNRDRVQPLLEKLKALNPYYANILVADRTGKVWAAVAMPPPPSMVADRRYFKNCLSTGRLSSGEYVISKSLSRPFFHFAYPYRDRLGQIGGVIIVAFSLDKFLDVVKQSPLPRDLNILLLDHKGTILTRAINPQKVVGTLYPQAALKEMLAGPDEASYRGMGSMEDERFISYRKIRLAGEATPYLYVRVGVPVKTVVAAANRNTAKSMAVLSAVLLGTLLLANLIGKRSIADRIAVLQDASRLLAEGNLKEPVCRNIEGGELGSLAKSFDLMAEKLAEREKALHDREARLRSITESAHDAILMTEPGGAICYWNRAAEKTLGYRADEALGQDLQKLLAPPSYLDAFKSAFADFVGLGMEAAPGKTVELAALSKEGKEVPVSLSLSSVELDGRRHAVLILRDITERRRLENQLRQSLKMESIGRLAGGVAHDFNNKLLVIMGHAELAGMDLQDPEKVAEHLRQIMRAAEHSRDITAQLLAFSRQQVVMPRVLDVNRVIGDTMKSLSRLIGEHVEVRFVPGHGLWNVRIDPVQLDQVVMNLAVNAQDAMPEGGSFLIATGNVSCEPHQIPEDSDASGTDFVRIAFRDSGSGMDASTMKHIFEPFFTTKEWGRGTGLGLATIYGIVQQNKGFIEVFSELGKGTEFAVYLPRQDESAEATLGAEAAAPVKGSGTILLVEDDDGVREMAHAFLVKLGYEILQAATPAEALRLVSDPSARVDLMITDVVMPGMNGRALMERIEAVRPGMRCIFVSGYPFEVLPIDEKLQGLNFLQKPYTMPVLSEMISRVMSTPA